MDRVPNIDIPSQIGGYRLLDRLGEGAHSIVYRACSISGPAREVAIKISPVQAEASLEARVRFEHEARILATLAHPNIVMLLDHGVAPQYRYLVTELAAGVSLKQLLASGRLPPPIQVAAWLQQVAHALAHAHRRQVLHRDIKPSNIIVVNATVAGEAPGGASDVPGVRLIDFGLSRLLEPWRNGSGDGQTVGTFLYMSPEQMGLGPRGADERSDLYSLGIVAVELLTGRHPFAGQSLRELVHSHATVLPMLPDAVPLVLRQIVGLLIAKDPTDRYRTANGLASDLGRFLKRARRGDDSAFPLRAQDNRKALAPPRFLGRERERDLLERAYARAGDSFQSVALGGLSGLGKTRLLFEASRDWTRSVVLWARGRAFGQTAAYGVIADALRMLPRCGLPLQAQRALREAVGERGGDVLALVPELRGLLGDAVEPVPLEPERAQLRFFGALSALLNALGSPQAPLVLILDHMQWADEASLDFIRYFARDAAPRQVLLLMAYRADEVDPWCGMHTLLDQLTERHGLVRVNLQRLQDPQVSAIVASMVGSDQPEVARAVAVQAEGSPLHAVELVTALAEQRLQARGGGPTGVRVAEALASVNLSGSLAATIVGRLDRLDDDAREVLRIAAVAGPGFDASLVRRVVEAESGISAELAAHRTVLALNEAESLHLLTRPNDGETYAFAHDKIREALYEGLVLAHRARLHGHVGHVIEERGTDDPAQVYLLAHHFRFGADPERGAHHARAAAELAQRQHAYREALDFYEQCRLHLDELIPAQRQPLEAGLTEAIADVCAMLCLHERAIAGYEAQLMAAHQGAGTDDDVARLYRKIGHAHHAGGNDARAAAALEASMRALGESLPRSGSGLVLRLLREALVQAGHSLRLPLAAPSRAPRQIEIVRSLALLSSVYANTDPRRALVCHLRQLNLAERDRLESELGAVWSAHGPACCRLPWSARASRYGQRSLAWRQRLGDRWGAAQSRCQLVHTLGAAGRWQEAEEHARIAKAELEQIGDRWELATALHFQAMNQIYLARWDELGSCVLHLQRVCAEIGNRTLSEVVTHAAHGEVPSGNPQTQLLAIEDTLANHADSIDNFHRVRLTNVKARLLMRLGRHALAENEFVTAKTLLRFSRLRNNYLMDAYPGHAEALLNLADEEADDTRRRVLLQRAGRALREARVRTWGFPNHAAHLLRMRARHAWALGALGRAERLWQRALNAAADCRQRYQAALWHLDKGFALREVDPARSANLLRQAGELLAALGASHDVARLAPILHALGDAPLTIHSAHALDAAAPRLVPMPAGIAAERLRALCGTLQRMVGAASLDQLLQAIVDSAARLLNAERGELFLWDDAREKLVRRTGCSALDEPVRPVSSTILALVLRERRGVMLADAQAEAALASAPSVASSGVHSVLCVPLTFQDRLLGALYLDNRLVSGLFAADDLELLEAYASQVAVALETQAVEARLRQSELQLSLIVDAASETYWDCDLASGRVQITPRWYHDIGREPEAARDAPVWFGGLFHEDDEQRLKGALHQCAIGVAKSVAGEYRVRQRGVDALWFLLRGKTVSWDDAGKPRRMLGTLQEITERKHTERQREAYLERLEALIDLDRAILEADSPERVAAQALRHMQHLITFGCACAMRFDRDRGEALLLASIGLPTTRARDRGAGAYPVGATLSLDHFAASDLEVLLRGKGCTVNEFDPTPSDAQMVLDLHAAGMRSYLLVPLRVSQEATGALLIASRERDYFDGGAVSIAWSIANPLAIALQQATLRLRVEQQAAELEHRVVERTEQLAMANRELQGFSYTVSHDLRAPLRNMDGLASLALQSLPDAPDKSRDYLALLRSAATKMNRLIDDLLAFSKAGAAALQRAPVDLNAVVAEARELCEPALQGERCVDWQVQSAPTVMGDHALLRVAFFNLLSNAIKFTRQRDPAVIRLEARALSEQRVEVRVSDNGAGFDSSQQHRLFGVFQRLHSERDFEGTGIGLATVRRVVECHGGTVRAESVAGTGATFVVVLPLVPPGPLSVEAPTALH